MWLAYFILTELTAQFSIGIAGAYSVIKGDLKKQLGITQSFFGVMEMVAMLTRMVVSLQLILIPSKAPKMTYFKYIIVTAISCGLIMISQSVPSAAKVLVFIGVMGLAPIRACSTLPYLLAYQYLSGPQFVTALNMWTGLNKLGNIWAYFLKYLFVNMLSYSFIVFIGVYCAIFLIMGVLTFFFIKEIEMPEEEELPCCQEAMAASTALKVFYTKQTSNWLLLCDFSFQENTFISLKFWLPLYLIDIGLNSQYLFIMMMFPIAVTLGSLLNFIIARWPQHKAIFTSLFLFLSFISFTALFLLNSDQSQIVYYYISIGFGFFFVSTPFSRVATSEVAQRVQSMRQKYLVMNSLKLIREILSAIFMLLIGVCMEKNHRSFLYFVSLNGFLAFFFHVWRRIVEAREQREREENQLQPVNSDSSF